MSLIPWDSGDCSAKEYRTLEKTELNIISGETLPGELLEIKPFKNNDGIEAGANLLQALHDVRIRDGRNVSDAHAFEIWFNRGQFSFHLYAANERASDRFKRRTSNTYTNSEIMPAEEGSNFPTLQPLDHVAACFLTLEDHTFLPIRHHNAEGFPHGDPYSDIMGEMLTLDDSVVVLQVIFKPADKSWTTNGPNGESVSDVAADIRSGEVGGFKDPLFWLGIRELEERESTRKDKEAAKIVEQQRGEQGFHVNIRILAASPDPLEARERARGLGSMFAKYYNASTEQGLDHNPVEACPEVLSGFVADMYKRQWQDRAMILSIDELAGVAHIPNADIEVPQIPWKTTKTGSQIAAEAVKDGQETIGSNGGDSIGAIATHDTRDDTSADGGDL